MTLPLNTSPTHPHTRARTHTHESINSLETSFSLISVENTIPGLRFETYCIKPALPRCLCINTQETWIWLKRGESLGFCFVFIFPFGVLVGTLCTQYWTPLLTSKSLQLRKQLWAGVCFACFDVCFITCGIFETSRGELIRMDKWESCEQVGQKLWGDWKCLWPLRVCGGACTFS